MYRLPSFNRGFTLIELLIVIAIIGMLATMILANLNAARAQARDAERANDMLQIANALEIYYNRYGRYPDGSHATYSACEFSTSFRPGDGCLNELVAEGLLPELPQDPMNTADYGVSTTNWPNSHIYMYSNWCHDPIGVSSQKYRVWSVSEEPQREDGIDWWDGGAIDGRIIGKTSCIDPS